MSLLRVCTSCRQAKPFECFNRARLGKYGLSAVCRACNRVRWQLWKKGQAA
jgi:hypothetical protein